MAFINFKTCCRDTKQLIRLTVLIICIFISCFQLTKCFRKIKHPPVSTHHGFYSNDTLRYPAATVCRNPPYKTERFDEFGFTENKDIGIASTWRFFKYDQYSLQQFFENTTYTFQEIFKIAALDKKPDNIQVSTSFTLKYGRCLTVRPKVSSKTWGSEYGYFFVFSRISGKTRDFSEESLSGFHVFIQDEVETFTEKSDQADMFKEYIYVEAGDAIQVNIKIHRFNQLSTSSSPCDSEYNYSKSQCVEDGANKLITESVGCSTPWVPNEYLPACKTFGQTQKIVEYSTPSEYLDGFLQQTQCIDRCNVTTYMPFLQSIRTATKSNFGIKIYFSTNLYTMMEEIAGYDWNALLADLGGSLGFLLGLSVLSMIGLAEEVFAMFMKMRESRRAKVELNNKNKGEGDISNNKFAKMQNELQLEKSVSEKYNLDFNECRKDNLFEKSNEKY